MQRSLSIGAIVLGIIGVLLCGVAIGVGWWVAAASVGRLTRIADRLDHGLSEADSGLARVEERMNAVRLGLDEIQAEAARTVAENPELPRVQAAIEQLFGQLNQALDRADAIADSLKSVTAGLQTTADILDQLSVGPKLPNRIRDAAGTIDNAADKLHGLQTQIEDRKLVKTAQIADEFVERVRGAIANSKRLAEGLVAIRGDIPDIRERIVEWRERVVFWHHVAVAIHTIVCCWAALGQLCLAGCGRRRLALMKAGAVGGQ
jgi:hypothetical protein